MAPLRRAMDIGEFLWSQRSFTALSLWSFPQLPPQYFALTCADGDVYRIRCDMVEVGARNEFGVLVLDRAPSVVPASATVTALAGEATLESTWRISFPRDHHSTGFRLRFDIGELIVVPGSMPHSICVYRDGQFWGHPAYSVQDWHQPKAQSAGPGQAR